jgi:hypothetical protein
LNEGSSEGREWKLDDDHSGRDMNQVIYHFFGILDYAPRMSPRGWAAPAGTMHQHGRL